MVSILYFYICRKTDKVSFFMQVPENQTFNVPRGTSKQQMETLKLTPELKNEINYLLRHYLGKYKIDETSNGVRLFFKYSIGTSILKPLIQFSETKKYELFLMESEDNFAVKILIDYKN